MGAWFASELEETSATIVFFSLGRAREEDLSSKKRGVSQTPSVPSRRKRALEVIGRRLERVIQGDFIDSLGGIDEPWNGRRSLKVRDALSFHDVLD